MFGRPRCREWTPLATQQLRLRSLVQIVGYNIRPPEWCNSQCSFYVTLHHTTMSAPFYTSERISSPHPKWKEIDSELTHRMSSTNVVIRIWCHIPHPREEDNVKYQDTVIQTWGVYFSGLRYIGANLALNFTADCFKSNTLVFQMQGGYFCSYKSLKLDVIPPENELEHGSLSSSSSGKTNLSKITLEPKFIQHNKLKEARSISPSKFSKKYDKEYSKSNSPVERGMKQNFATIKSSTSLNIGHSRKEETKNDPNYIYEHSPDHLDVKELPTGTLNCFGVSKSSLEDLDDDNIDLSETAENYDLRNESDMPKYRYVTISFLKSEIRPSYNATKLQKLHLLQYSIKKKQDAVQEIKERIYTKSAVANEPWSQNDELDIKSRVKSKSQKNLFSLEEGLAKEKSSSQNDLSVKNGKVKEERTTVSNGPRLTLKLNDLLSIKSKPSPFQRAEHIRLTKQLEIYRFKRIILTDERDAKLVSIRKLKERHSKLLEENQDVGVELMEDYHTLSRRIEDMKEMRTSCAAMRDLAARSHAALLARRQELLAQLLQIFYIEQVKPTVWTICGVRLPICGDERRSSTVCESIAAGYAAHATVLAAMFLNQPMRYKVTLLGSASKILDTTPDLPDPNIPLYARKHDTILFHYAMFLLNKCIAQLLWGRGIPIHDMRPTLANLQRLLTTPNNAAETSKLFGTYKWQADNQSRAQSLRSLVASERGKYRQFNRFKDSVDGQSPQSAMKKHRNTRSVGSYHDDQEMPTLDASTTSIMGSESNIYNMKLTEASSSDHQLKPHNSDSEIQRIAGGGDNNKIVFTLGDDTTLSNLNSQTLVRISTNNQDVSLNENVKRICSEIESYCSTSDVVETVRSREKIESFDSTTDKQNEIHEGFDVAMHMEAMTDSTAQQMDKTNYEKCEMCRHKVVCKFVSSSKIPEVIIIKGRCADANDGTDGRK